MTEPILLLIEMLLSVIKGNPSFYPFPRAFSDLFRVTDPFHRPQDDTDVLLDLDTGKNTLELYTHYDC